jgi:hypothetical protein
MAYFLQSYKMRPLREAFGKIIQRPGNFVTGATCRL